MKNSSFPVKGFERPKTDILKEGFSRAELYNRLGVGEYFHSDVGAISGAEPVLSLVEHQSFPPNSRRILEDLQHSLSGITATTLLLSTRDRFRNIPPMDYISPKAMDVGLAA